MSKISIEEYNRRLQLSLSEKIKWTIERYIDFVEVYGVNGVYQSFSGGKDSQIVADIIDRLHNGEFVHYLEKEYIFLYEKLIKNNPSPPKVFCDTKLEFPELRDHVKSFDNVVWLKPVKMYKDVVKENGYAVGSKKIARMISDIRNPTPNNLATRKLYLTGIKKDGTKTSHFKLPEKWKRLINAPFKVSGECCNFFKKMPFKAYEKQTGRLPIIGTTAAESAQRKFSYLQTGCNSFDKGGARSRPLSIWHEQDVWSYSVMMKIRFCEVYYDRVVNGFSVKGERQTGCVICLFGITQEDKKEENRIQRLAKTHPKMYKFFIYETGIKEVLEFIGVPYKPNNCNQLDLFKR